MYRIIIEKIPVSVIIGTKPFERIKPQIVFVDLTVEYEGWKAAGTDKLADGLDYEALTNEVCRSAGRVKYYLLETLCNHIASFIISRPLVKAVTVRITKPDSLGKGKSVTMELYKEKDKN